MKDPATGRVLQMVGNNDLPHSPLGADTAILSTTEQGLEGFFSMLNLPGMPSAPDAGQDNQMSLNERLYADHNLTAVYKVLPWTSTPTGGEDFIPTMASYYVATGNFATQYGAALPPNWGRDYTTGNNLPTVMRDLPRRGSPAEMPVLSLGYLQHASLGADDFYPFPVTQNGQPIGNSWFNPYVTRTASVQPRNDYCYGGLSGTGLILPVAPPGLPGQTTYYDMAYLLNTALWDRYYFSSIPQVTAASGLPANPRLKFVTGQTPTAAQLGLGPGTTPAADPAGLLLPKESVAARYLMIDGAFNINSTSIEAWKAVLASLRKRNATVNDTSGATTASSSFPRSLYQTGNSPGADTGTNVNSFAGFRKLGDAQIATLAACLVQEIRLRGPFVSLAHFVNRTGLTGNTTGNLAANTANTVQVAGALQMAIDRALLNTRNFAGNDSDAATAVVDDLSGAYPYADTMPTATITASTATSPPPGTGVTLNKSTGIPGWLTQGDVLEALGPVLAARSDTFLIRAYGESLDPVNVDPANIRPENILARSWCEAVVQRFPDYVDPANAASVDPNGSTGTGATISAVNQTFGRKFRIVAFRWLTPNDI